MQPDPYSLGNRSATDLLRGQPVSVLAAYCTRALGWRLIVARTDPLSTGMPPALARRALVAATAEIAREREAWAADAWAAIAAVTERRSA